jgi:hypothetical protein
VSGLSLGLLLLALSPVAFSDDRGVLVALGQLLQDQPERDVEQTTDRVTEDLLRMFGVPRRQAHRICSRPLPHVDGRGGNDSAA